MERGTHREQSRMKLRPPGEHLLSALAGRAELSWGFWVYLDRLLLLENRREVG